MPSLDWCRALPAVFPNLKPSTRTISLRLPESLLNELKQLANEQDVPYQSMIKMILRERIDRDYRARSRASSAAPGCAPIVTTRMGT